MKCPVLSRWERVGEAVEHVVKYKEQWLVMTRKISDMNNVGTYKDDISSYLYSYLKEDVIYAQLLFVHGYITGYFDRHLQWHKQICPKSNRAGFRAIDMGVNIYIVHRDCIHPTPPSLYILSKRGGRCGDWQPDQIGKI